MKFENIEVYNFSGALRGMRNPKESWALSDSQFGLIPLTDDCGLGVATEWANQTDRTLAANFVTDEDIIYDYLLWLWRNGILNASEDGKYGEVAFIGPKDMKLAQQLISAGSEHRKFMRQIIVSVDITAPIFFWKEFDTYKVGTVANSTSTMHKLATTPITLNCFETDDFNDTLIIDKEPIEQYEDELFFDHWHIDFIIENFIEQLEELRRTYLQTKDPIYWKELIRWLPESWLQKRTITMNYENLLAMCSPGQRRFHKLTEWSNSFIKFVRQLPYAQELIFLDETNNKVAIN